MSDVTRPDSLLVTVARAALPDDGWTVRTDQAWCFIHPAGYGFARQGWKIHVSATPLSAPHVLERSARVLVRHGCAFKFAPTIERVGDLVHPKADRTGAGKFITAYPGPCIDLPDLAHALHHSTFGLPGPRILSDRHYRPGSLVHLRYGVHAAAPVISDDGRLHRRLLDPDGVETPDRREAWFVLPEWVDDPFPPTPMPQSTAPTPTSAQAAGGKVLLAGRYRVHTAITHANKGGVFRAADERGGEVVIKQARAHVGATLSGRDAQTLLRAEAEALDILHPLGLCPRRVDLFTVEDSLFIAEEHLDGDTLADWVIGRLWPGLSPDESLPPADVLPIAMKIAQLTEAVHHAGFRIGDLTPSNLMILPDETVRCVDLEAAGPVGARPAPIGTPGYLPPEFEARMADDDEYGVSGDLYALGGVLFHLATALNPAVLDDEPTPCRADRLATLVGLHSPHSAALALLSPAITGLMADRPRERWSVPRLRSFLASLPAEPGQAGTPMPAMPVTSRESPIAPAGFPVSPAELLASLADYLSEVSVLEPGPPDGTDPRTVYAGAAGLLAVLTHIDPRSPAVAALIEQLRSPPPAGPVLPGLFTGTAGVAWAAFDAARARGDDPAWALGLARQVPASWHIPDVVHGLAGAGLTMLHLWRSSAGTEFLDRAIQCADGLAAAATEVPTGLMWPFPIDADTDLAGQAHYGFAHGNAGIGTFLLSVASATGNDEYRRLAVRAGRTLAANAQGDSRTAWWYVDPTEQRAGGFPASAAHWCSGASGVGTFLVRLWLATDDSDWLDLARAAARTVRAEAWGTSNCYCHGLAGNGDFLLDMATATGEPEYRAWADDLATAIAVTAARRGGRWVTPDETQIAISPGFATGAGGTAAFLYRLIHGGSRWWMVDPPALSCRRTRCHRTPAPATATATDARTPRPTPAVPIDCEEVKTS